MRPSPAAPVHCLREQTAEPLLVDAAELARRLSVPASWVYRHADELGAVRLGDGPKAGVRFDPAEAAARLAARRARERPVDPPRRSTSRERRQPTGERTAAGARLLPYVAEKTAPWRKAGVSRAAV